jgi:hypothetical protein
VTVKLDAAPVADGYRVTLTAVPTRAVPALELSLAGKKLRFGATAAGQRRDFTVHVPVAAGAGADVVGSASASGRNKAAVLRVGAARAQAVKRAVPRTLPDGSVVSEAR